MPQVIIENPIVNSPFAEPSRHFRFTDEGITDEIVASRRISSYFVPIPRAKKKGKQLVFDTDTNYGAYLLHRVVRRMVDNPDQPRHPAE